MKDSAFKRADSLFSLCGLNCSLCLQFVRRKSGGKYDSAGESGIHGAAITYMRGRENLVLELRITDDPFFK